MIVRQLARLLLLVAVPLCACATPGVASREDDGRTDSSADTRPSPATASRVPSSRQPTEDELAAAFEASEEFDAPQAKSAASKGASPAQAHPEDPLADQKRQFEAQAQDAKDATAARAPDAMQKAEALLPLASPLGPMFVSRAWQLRAEVALALGESNLAFEHARASLTSCGPQQVDRCRAAALQLLTKSAPKSRNPAKAKAFLTELREADACLKAAEGAARRGGSVPPCAAAAGRFFRRWKDGLMQARLGTAQAQAELRDPKKTDRAVRALEKAESTCAEARCVEVRRAALAPQVDAHLAKEDFASATRAALRDMQLYASTLPAHRQPYAWTNNMDRACAALDRVEGPGACRKLEQRLGGALTYKDFSQVSAGEGLGPEAVREVNAHYSVTFQECLGAEAQRLTASAQVQSSQSYRVRWVVQNDGRAGELRMDRKELDDGPLAQCLRRKLAVWRYPRYEGELQHVEQSFVISASTRR